jgi:hypothetical protein
MRAHWSQIGVSPGGPLPRAADSTSLEIFRWQPPHLPSCTGTTTGIPAREPSGRKYAHCRAVHRRAGRGHVGLSPLERLRKVRCPLVERLDPGFVAGDILLHRPFGGGEPLLCLIDRSTSPPAPCPRARRYVPLGGRDLVAKRLVFVILADGQLLGPVLAQLGFGTTPQN